MNVEFNRWMDARLDGFVGDLADLVGIDTVSPGENRAYPWLAAYFEDLGGRVRELHRHPRTLTHQASNLNEYAALPAQARSSLRVEFSSASRIPTRHTLFSAHVDVVPAGPEFATAFTAEVSEGRIIGRGVADTKGNIVMIAAALRFLRDAGRSLDGRVTVDLVPEEEIGGNGALSSILHGSDATEVIALEPTGLEVFHGHRGCVGFAVDFTGQSSHMGATGVSAIDGAVEFVSLLRELERELLAQARALPCFTGFDRPIQINVGVISGGQWAGSIPERCTVEGFFGFVPGSSAADVLKSLDGLIAQLSHPWHRSHATVRQHAIRNGAYLSDPDCEVARDLRAAARTAGLAPGVHRAWNVSCDARLYHDLLGVPTVVFGAGDLTDAHSSREGLRIADWVQGVRILSEFLSHGSTAAAATTMPES